MPFVARSGMASVTSLKYRDALQLAVGTSTGQVVFVLNIVLSIFARKTICHITTCIVLLIYVCTNKYTLRTCMYCIAYLQFKLMLDVFADSSL